MNFGPHIKWIAAGLLATVVIFSRVWTGFDYRETQLLADYQTWLGDQQRSWSQQDAQRAVDAAQRARQIRSAHREELVKALGGPIAAATKDPRLDIREMLLRIARKCAPPHTRVSVTVDRFTEFEVAFVLPKTLSASELAVLCKPLLDSGTPYLHSVRFILGNDILAELNSSAIESVTNWSAASTETVERQLAAGGTSPPRNDSAMTPNSEMATADLTEDQKKIQAGQTALNEIFSEHWKDLAQMVSNLNRSTLLDSFQNSSQMQARINRLDKLEPSVAAEREFFLNQSAELERLLQEQGLDSLLIAIEKRSMNDRSKGEMPFITNTFDALSAYRIGNREFLAGMAALWGEWEADAGSQQIQFTTTAAKDTYTAESANTRRRAEAVIQAFQSWTDYQKSQRAAH